MSAIAGTRGGLQISRAAPRRGAAWRSRLAPIAVSFAALAAACSSQDPQAPVGHISQALRNCDGQNDVFCQEYCKTIGIPEPNCMGVCQPDPDNPGHLGCNCSLPTTCNDNIACTNDSCDSGVNACMNEPDDGLCPPGWACQPDEDGCREEPNCHADADCEDLDACTQDLCKPTGGCTHLPITGCDAGVESGPGEGGAEDAGSNDDGGEADADAEGGSTGGGGGAGQDAATGAGGAAEGGGGDGDPGGQGGATVVEDVTTEDGGCACGVTPPRAPFSLWFGAALFALGLIRRGRRTGPPLRPEPIPGDP